MKRYKFEVIISLVVIALVGLLLFSYQSEPEEEAQIAFRSAALEGNQIAAREDLITQTNAQEEILTLTKQALESIMDEFIDILVQDIDDNYKVIGLTTKAELIDEFSTIATAEVVEPYISFYYHEEADGLYIVPTELPPWFIAGQPYDMEVTNDGTVKISQENSLELYGDYRIEIELIYQETGWKIIEIEHPPTEHDTIESNDII
jgi:hypothetical protein